MRVVRIRSLSLYHTPRTMHVLRTSLKWARATARPRRRKKYTFPHHLLAVFIFAHILLRSATRQQQHFQFVGKHPATYAQMKKRSKKRKRRIAHSESRSEERMSNKKSNLRDECICWNWSSFIPISNDSHVFFPAIIISARFIPVFAFIVSVYLSSL